MPRATNGTNDGDRSKAEIILGTDGTACDGDRWRDDHGDQADGSGRRCTARRRDSITIRTITYGLRMAPTMAEPPARS